MIRTVALWLALCAASGWAIQTTQPDTARNSKLEIRNSVSLHHAIAQSPDHPITPVDKKRAENALKEGSRAYKARNFVEAEEYFKTALGLDPTSKNAAFLVARSIHAQYRPGVETAENIAKAREAIAAYQKVLAKNPNHDAAYDAIAYLYGALKEDEEQREWITRHASLPGVPKEKRAATYTTLAGKDWNCSYKITELPENKQTVMQGGKAIMQSKKPKDQRDFDTAKQCAARGLELAEKAIRLNRENESAWSYKIKLLVEMARLAEMEGKAEQKADYTKKAAQAQARTAEVSEQNRKKAEALPTY